MSSVPALIMVAPVYVFAPVSVVLPVPDCVTAPAPESTPDAVSVPLWLKLIVPESATELAKVEPVASFSSRR